MKQERDMNKLREVLLYIMREIEPGGSINSPIRPKDEYHIYLLEDAGFIECKINRFKGGCFINNIRITNDGHDFYETLKDDRVWNEVEKEVAKEGKKISDFALPVLLNIGYDVLKRQVGLE